MERMHIALQAFELSGLGFSTRRGCVLACRFGTLWERSTWCQGDVIAWAVGACGHFGGRRVWYGMVGGVLGPGLETWGPCCWKLFCPPLACRFIAQE